MRDTPITACCPSAGHRLSAGLDQLISMSGHPGAPTSGGLSTSAHRQISASRKRLLDNSHRAGVWPDSVQVIGGRLSKRLPTG